MTEPCNAAHKYVASKTPSGYVCILPAGHPREHIDDYAATRRWTEPTTVVPNRRDRRAQHRQAMKALRKLGR